MKFFDKHLIANETIFHRTYFQSFTFSRLVIFFPMFWNIVGNKTFNDIVVTNKRVAIRRLVGLTIENDEIHGRLIRSADISQSIIGHIFNYGNVIVTGSTNKHNYYFEGVSAPNELQQAILSMMRGTIESDYSCD